MEETIRTLYDNVIAAADLAPLVKLHDAVKTPSAPSVAPAAPAMSAMPEAPWADLGGKELNDGGLAARLRKYEITSKQVREDGVTQLRGYRRVDLHDAWMRYLGPPPDTTVTTVTHKGLL